jgi:hypothetical protein
MSDSYQATYDAVRSRISNGDIGSAVENALRTESIGYHFQQAANTISEEHTRPSVIYRPKLAPDGNAWIALYGDNLQEGVAGCGDSPAEAMADFDRNWFASLAKALGQA